MTQEDEKMRERTKNAAARFREWATAQNLLQVDTAEEPDDEIDIEEEFDRGEDFRSQNTIDVFKRREILLIAYNDVEHEVVVYTRRKLSKKDAENIPDALDDEIGIRVVQGGAPFVSGRTYSSIRPYYQVADTFYCCGSSIFVGDCRGAGSLGALLRDREGVLVGLTNNHVGGGCNHTPIEMPIVAPGSVDVHQDGIDPFTIGRHLSVIPFTAGSPDHVNVSANTDAAIFRIRDEARVSSMQGNFYDTPASVMDPTCSMRVTKVGRSTGLTRGIIRAKTVGAEAVAYAVAEFDMKDVVYFSEVYIVEGEGRPFSAPGDSGSLVCTEDENGRRHAVGIVFAGHKFGNHTFILPLRPLLHHWGLTLVAGHNTVA
ncbi:MAG: hypothetical protein ABL308_08450 [Oceanicaulis sp.]